MPITLELQFKTKRYADAMKGLMAFGDSVQKSFDSLAPIFRNELQTYLDSVAEALAQRHGNPWPAGTGGMSLSRRSGALIQTIRDSVAVYGDSLDSIYGTIGASVIYGQIQESGGTVRPKKGRYLTVPLPAALNSDGTPKFASARQWDKAFVIRSKAGNLLIVRKVGSDLVPLYVLKTEVYIPPRLHMGDTLRAGIPYFVDRTMDLMMQELQAGIAKGMG